MATAVEPDIEFDLNRTIVEELEGSADPDPESVVGHVMRRIPHSAYSSVIAYLLVQHVRHVAVLRGRQAQANLPGPSRWEGVAVIFRRRLAMDASGERWRFLGECSGDDLRSAAKLRRDQAEASVVWAQRYEALADMLSQLGVEQVKELDPAVVEQVLQA